MGYLEREHLVVGQRYRCSQYGDLHELVFEARLLMVLEQGEVDPLVVLDEETAKRDPEANQVGWQQPRTYWEGGLIIDGHFDHIEWIPDEPS